MLIRKKEFVAYFKDHVQDLKNKYDKVYLIRNERQLNFIYFITHSINFLSNPQNVAD